MISDDKEFHSTILEGENDCLYDSILADSTLKDGVVCVKLLSVGMWGTFTNLYSAISST